MKNTNFFIGDLTKLQLDKGYIFLRSRNFSDWEFYKNENHIRNPLSSKSFRINANDIFYIVDFCHSEDWGHTIFFMLSFK